MIVPSVGLILRRWLLSIQAVGNERQETGNGGTSRALVQFSVEAGPTIRPPFANHQENDDELFSEPT